MNAPTGGMSLEDFQKAMESHVSLNYHETQDGYVCNKCGTKIQQTTCFASIHTAEFGDCHAGSGEVRRFPLPFCPECEGVPSKTDTCIHIPFSCEF